MNQRKQIENTQMAPKVIKTNKIPSIFSADHEIFSVFLSCVPILIIVFLQKLISFALSLSEISLSSSLYFILLTTIFSLSNIISFITLFSLMKFPIYWRSCVTLNVFLIGYMIATQNRYPYMWSFGIYLLFLSSFHLSEFLATAFFNYKALKVDSFLLNHSFEYKLAAFSSWFEFFIEMFLWPEMKMNFYLHFIGILLMISGEICRKLAMYTAGKNFNHLVQEVKNKEHVLVTHGIYRYIRHPSYFGWFYWSIGTQICLANPICLIGYTIASWKFFNSRILYEEYHLVKFFGKQYIEYQNRVASGVPFVKGYVDLHEELD